VKRKQFDKILLAHGSGGKAMHDLIDELFLPAFRNPKLEPLDDSALIEIGGRIIAFTSDSYTVDPIFFPGGDIGFLAVCGTVNDLAVCGAVPLALSCGLILEEGLPVDDLERILSSMKAAAAEAGVEIVTGDTKVLPRGKGDKIFINTSGIGLLPEGRKPLAKNNIQPGDKVLINGSIADHGAAVMAEREEFALRAEITSDVAPLNGLIECLLAAVPATRCLKDPTRGGVASALNEIAAASKATIVLEEKALPVRKPVAILCELLGLDPLYFANEGKVLAIVPAAHAESALKAMQSHSLGAEAAVIGEVTTRTNAPLVLRTPYGSHRVVGMLTGEQLPRIC
jgi:hydrogenase expression/formation protein HypE